MTITACAYVGMALKRIISLFRTSLFHSKSESQNPFKFTIFDSFILKLLLFVHVPGIKIPVTGI